MKPVELVERAIRNSSRPGSAVLDPFGGSGTTLIAAEKSGRAARLIELDPKYVDVIVRRWEDFTGQQATREAGIHLETQMRMGHTEFSFKAICAESTTQGDRRTLATPALAREDLFVRTKGPPLIATPTQHSSVSRNHAAIEPPSNPANPSPAASSCRCSAGRNLSRFSAR